MPYQHVTVPADGAKITIRDGKLHVPDRPIVPFIEGDGTGPDIWRASVRVLDAAVAKAYGGRRKIAWMEVYAGREGLQAVRQLAARRDGRGLPRVPGRHQGPAHHPDRRRHPLAERGAAADARSLRLPPPRALVRGGAVPREAPREGGHGHLPGEHRGHLRRDRVRERHRGREEGPGVPEGDFPEGLRQGPLPRDDRGRLQAGVGRGQRAAHPGGHRVRARQRAQEPHPRPQGQHHEVHRGRLPQLGLRPGRAGVRRSGLHLGPVGAHEAGEGRGSGQRRAEGGARLRQAAGQGRDRRHHAAAGPHAAGRVRRHRDPQPERRLPLGRARGPGGRDRHRPRRQHQLHDRARGLRGDPRHRAEVREPRQGQPRLGGAVRGDDAALPGLDGGRRPRHQGHGRGHLRPHASPTTSPGRWRGRRK